MQTSYKKRWKTRAERDKQVQKLTKKELRKEKRLRGKATRRKKQLQRRNKKKGHHSREQILGGRRRTKRSENNKQRDKVTGIIIIIACICIAPFTVPKALYRDVQETQNPQWCQDINPGSAKTTTSQSCSYRGGGLCLRPAPRRLIIPRQLCQLHGSLEHKHHLKHMQGSASLFLLSRGSTRWAENPSLRCTNASLSGKLRGECMLASRPIASPFVYDRFTRVWTVAAAGLHLPDLVAVHGEG